jgi:hypothetical protein
LWYEGTLSNIEKAIEGPQGSRDGDERRHSFEVLAATISAAIRRRPSGAQAVSAAVESKLQAGRISKEEANRLLEF